MAMNIHVRVCSRAIRRIDASVDESIIFMLQFRYVDIEHLLNVI